MIWISLVLIYLAESSYSFHLKKSMSLLCILIQLSMFEVTLFFRKKFKKFETPAENNGLLSTGGTIFDHRNYCFPVWNRLDIISWKFHGKTITTSWNIMGVGGIRPPPGPYQHQNNPGQIGLKEYHTTIQSIKFAWILFVVVSQNKIDQKILHRIERTALFL